MLTDDLRATHAALVPVYVTAVGSHTAFGDDAWALTETSTNETLSTHDTARQALIAATKREDVQALGKRANLREDGEPIGVWRWLDASAEEDEPVGGSRITAASLWEMSASLNGRKSAIPINGGGAPRAGLGDSVPHGDAYTGGDHLANGYAHIAFPVIDHTGRTHLYLRSELLPEIAREVDLGRLAYGSIRFGFDEIDANDNDAIKGAVLISHALTNDPAVTTLTAGSERRRESEPVNVACRSRRMIPMSKQTSKRGPAADVLAKIATTLGITAEQMEENPWCLSDAVYALKDASKVEAIIEAASGTPAPAEGETVEAEARAVLRSIVHGAKFAGRREVEGVEPGEAEAMLETLVAIGREVLGKPDASPADVVAELTARKDEVTAALAPKDEPAEGEPGEGNEERADDKPAAEALDEEPKKVDPEPKDEDEKQRGAEREVLTSERARADKAEAALAAERKKVERFETREWLDAEIAKRGLAVPKPQRDKYLDTAIEKGRDVAEMILDARNAPPSGNPLEGTEEPGSQPTTQKAAWDACEPDAQREMDEAEAERAKRERREVRAVPRHEVRARAQKLAAQRFPTLFDARPADADAR